MDWDKLRIFHAVADAGSLTHAGDTLHLSQSAVSRQIRALEDSLNTTLFHRHARGLILTEQGELLFDATVAMTKRLDAAAAAGDRHGQRANRGRHAGAGVLRQAGDAADPWHQELAQRRHRVLGAPVGGAPAVGRVSFTT